MKRYGVLFSLIMVGSLAAMEMDDGPSPQATSPQEPIVVSRGRGSGDSYRVRAFLEAWSDESLARFEKRLQRAVERGSQQNSPSGSPDREMAFEWDDADPSAIAQRLLARGSGDRE